MNGSVQLGALRLGGFRTPLRLTRLVGADLNRVSSAAALQICKVLKLPIAELLGIDGPNSTPAQLDDALMMAIEMQKLSPKQRRALLKFAQAMASQ